MNLAGKLVRAFYTLSLRFTTPIRIEFNLTDYCNLNCKGCTHYSPLAVEDYVSISDLETNMQHLSSLRGCRDIRQIYLIGGETLLYPDIKNAITLARRYFPWAEISIFTNGLLIPRMDNDFWKLCRENDIIIAITRYPIKFDYDAAANICEQNGVRHSLFGDRSVFGSFFRVRLDPEKRQNRWLANFRCYSFGCLTVAGDRLYPCPQSACVRHLNRRFGTEFSVEKGDYLQISDITALRQIRRLRNRPIPFCGYCKKSLPTPYESSKRVKTEWIDYDK